MTAHSLLFLITQIYSSSYTTGQYTHEFTDSGNYVRVGSDIDMNATDCEAYCQDVFRTHLCSIHSDSDTEDIMGDGTFYTTFGEQMYIGLNDIETEGDYVWMDETSLDYENWGSKEDTTAENCVRIRYTDGRWNDISCSTGYNSFVCNYIEQVYYYEITDSGNYIRVGSSTEYDFEDSEAYCLDVFGTHLASVHSDSDTEDIMGDGTFYTTFGEQMYIGLNDIDTEGDYVWTDETSFDYENWGSKEDTTEENCVRIRYTDGRWNDVSCSTGYNSFVCNYDYYDSVDYFGVNIALNYTAADLYCQTQFGTHLATVTSSKENNDTRTAATNGGISTSDNIWMGYNDIDNEDTWVWLDGTRTDLYMNEYENWNDGEPSNGGTNGQDCGQIYADGTWDDDYCKETKPFVCNARPRTTQAPSYNPTSLPTSGPTDEPTNEPTNKPTNKPTAADEPTANPNTPFPSYASSTSTSTSSSATKQPSRAPVEVSTTGYPSVSLNSDISSSSIAMTTIIPTSIPTSSSDTNNTVDLITSNTGLIIVIVSIVVLLWCICACVCAHFKRKKTKEAIETAAASTVDRYAQYTNTSNQQSV